MSIAQSTFLCACAMKGQGFVPPYSSFEGFKYQPFPSSAPIFLSCASWLFLSVWSQHILAGQQHLYFLNVIWTLTHEAGQKAVSANDGEGKSLGGIL